MLCSEVVRELHARLQYVFDHAVTLTDDPQLLCAEGRGPPHSAEDFPQFVPQQKQGQHLQISIAEVPNLGGYRLVLNKAHSNPTCSAAAPTLCQQSYKKTSLITH
jgi:hypothetical protein